MTSLADASDVNLWGLWGWALALVLAAAVLILGRKRPPNAAPAPDPEPVPARACPDDHHYYVRVSGYLWKCESCPSLKVVGSPEVFDQEAADLVAGVEAMLRGVS